MARPIKNSCDYFPHDAGMRNHRKVKAIRQKFKAQGYAVWCMLLEYLTCSEGNKFDYSDIELELLSGDFEVSATEIREVIDYCILLKLLYLKDGKITSESLDERLKPVYDKRETNRSKSDRQPRIDGKFTANNSEPAVVSVTETPQIKEKEIKEKKRVKEETPAPLPDLSKSNLYRQPNIPTYEKVYECFKIKGGTGEMAKNFFSKYESTGWFLNNSPITNFDNLIPSYITNWKNNESKNGGMPVDSTKVKIVRP